MRVICSWCSRQYAEKCQCGWRTPDARIGATCPGCGRDLATDYDTSGICPECAERIKAEWAEGEKGEKDSL